MVHALSIWLLVAGFFGAGLFNAIGTPGTQSDFARWGYPRWWGIFTGGLEIMSAVLIALPVSRVIGLALGAVIIAAAVLMEWMPPPDGIVMCQGGDVCASHE